ncbi:MAG: diadenylate cyclase CdaA [Clostridia bacterium]|nr:diadenylate cyclase CdaA [Clostridia bacterium]
MTEVVQNLINSFGILDAIDIAVVAFLVYKALNFIRNSRTEQLIKGILALVVLFFISSILGLQTLTWALKSIFTIGFFALVVVFQPELRRALERVGQSKFLNGNFKNNTPKDNSRIVVDEIGNAVMDMSETKTGALIILERETVLGDIMESGTSVDARITAQMLENIFYEGAPLHDGAVIIRGDRIASAACVLPLTDDKDLNKALGTRHRAGIGITENSDALAIIISEETGYISLAQGGVLERPVDMKRVNQVLNEYYALGNSEPSTQLFKKIGGKKHAK